MYINLYENEKDLINIFNWIKLQIGPDILEVVSEYQLRGLDKFKFMMIFIGNYNDKLYVEFRRVAFTYSSNPYVLIAKSNDFEIKRLFKVNQEQNLSIIYFYYKSMKYQSKFQSTESSSHTDIIKFLNEQISLFEIVKTDI